MDGSPNEYYTRLLEIAQSILVYTDEKVLTSFQNCFLQSQSQACMKSQNYFITLKLR